MATPLEESDDHRLQPLGIRGQGHRDDSDILQRCSWSDRAAGGGEQSATGGGIPGAQRTLVFVGKTDGDHALELVHFIEPPSPDGHLHRHQLGAAHVCFNVDDLETLHRELTAQGVRFVTDPIFRELPDGGRFGICYAQDPEGNYLEFIQPGF